MRDLTQAEWHGVALADKIIEIDGYILGVIEDGETIIFYR